MKNIFRVPLTDVLLKVYLVNFCLNIWLKDLLKFCTDNLFIFFSKNDLLWAKMTLIISCTYIYP